MAIPLVFSLWLQSGHDPFTPFLAEGFSFTAFGSRSVGGAWKLQEPFHMLPSTCLYSTTEDDTETEAASKSEPEVNVEKMLEAGMDMLKDLGLENKKEEKEEPTPLVVQSVMVGANRSKIEGDSTMRQVTSELRVWKNFRQKEALSYPAIPVDVVAERTWDTVEDAAVHARRMAYEMGTLTLDPEEEATRKTVVVLGSGWGSHALFKVADCQKLRIIVVSPANHFVFTPMLASASVGTVEYGSMTEAVRSANPMIHDYIEGKATRVNVRKKKVTVKLNPLLTDVAGDEESPTIELDYDHLVVSVGSRVNDMNVPGARRYALRLKTTDDSRKLRTTVGECLEYASRPDVSAHTEEAEAERTQRVTFLIAGGGPTGVELAGEFCDLFADVTRQHSGTYPKLANNTRVILAHGGEDLVPQFEEPLRMEALKSLRAKGVEVYLNTRVTKVEEKSATLSIKQFDDETGEPLSERKDIEVPIGLAVWCAGTAPAGFCESLLKELPKEARNPDGRIKVDRWMRPPMKDPSLLGSVIVLGDAAAQQMDVTGALMPSTAQVAGQQGAFVARTLCRNYNMTATPPRMIVPDSASANPKDIFHDPPLANWLRFRGLDNCPPFTFLNLGLLAYLGGGEALSQVQVGDKKVVSKAGSIGFFLWRSVYLVKQVATRNRVLVTFDWVKSAIFGRDTTRM